MVNKGVEKIWISTFQEFPEKLGKTVRIGDQEIAVFKLTNGTIRAIENRCPHKNGVLSEGMVSGEYVFCPLHDWKISLIDGKVQEPNSGSVKMYKTLVEGDDVYLFIES